MKTRIKSGLNHAKRQIFCRDNGKTKRRRRQSGVFTADLHVGEDVLVLVQVAVEDEAHGKLSED